MSKIGLVFGFGLFSLFLAASSPPSKYDRFWPQWRGPHATGVAPHGNPPSTWDEATNIRWKVEIPGKGHASPIVWENTVYLLTAVESDSAPAVQEEEEPEPEDGRGRRRGIQPERAQRFTVIAIDRKDGSTKWQHVAREELPHEGTHMDGTWASNSAATDGKVLVAHFGSRGIYCYSLNGELKWKRDLGDMRTRNGFGEGSSPVIYDNRVVVNWDHEEDSFIVALDRKTGETVWKVDRDEVTSWSTPIVVEQDGKPQVIVSATNRVRGYDLATGESLWEAGGMTVNTIPSPVYEDGMVYVTSGFRGNNLLAIRLNQAKGDITDSEAIAWKYDRDTPYVPSPLLVGGHLYFLKSNRGILTCFDTKSGQPAYGPERLDGIEGVYASPVGADGRVYIAGREGTTLVLKQGPAMEVIASNKLDDSFNASPAIVDREIYLRGTRHLYCIAE